MNLLQQFVDYIADNQLFTKQDRLLLAVSGGLDSVVLCHLCQKAGFSFEIAHCNFGLRGDESIRDEAFVEELAAQLGVIFHVNHFDTKAYAAEKKVSIQVAARELRYAWFHELVYENVNRETPTVKLGAVSENLRSTSHDSRLTFIATAHHQDDNIETVLMNFFKGTGISGLHGILPKAGNLVRPLLFVQRETLMAFAKEHQLLWVEDSSNAETKYTRNFFRQELIPAIEKIFPTVKENIGNNIERFREVETLYQQAVTLHKKKLLEYKGAEVHIPVVKLQRLESLSSILYEILKEYGFTPQQVPEVIKLLSSESGRYITSATHRILRNRAWLIISTNVEVDETIVIIDEGNTEQIYARGQLLLQTLPKDAIAITIDPTIALLDASQVEYPLLLRKWKEGDYFYPLGMRKKKKLARFFIDQKLSKLEKETVWVVESSKRIVWVVGHRIDDRFKMETGTKLVLQIIDKKP